MAKNKLRQPPAIQNQLEDVPDTMTLDGNTIKAINKKTRNGFHVAYVHIPDTVHTTAVKKEKLLRLALQQLTPEQIRSVLSEE